MAFMDDVLAALAEWIPSWIQRITSGNFRLVIRLFSHAGRVLAINWMDVITHAVIKAARASLVLDRA
jgi:hypothetical protein